jgi:hypothetical protein
MKYVMANKYNDLEKLLEEYLDENNLMDSDCMIKVLRSTNRRAQAQMMLDMLKKKTVNSITSDAAEEANKHSDFVRVSAINECFNQWINSTHDYYLREWFREQTKSKS